MPRGQQFYEPEVQVQQATPIRGFQVSIGGVYVLLDDIITVVREYAQTLHPDDAALVHDLATWLQSGERPDPQIPAALSESVDEQTEPLSLVDRIEVYPDDPTSPEPRWVARACSAEGDILHVTGGSFNQAQTIQEAQNRWPGRDVHLLTEAGQDTVWEERDPGGIRSSSSGRRRPSPKRLFPGTPS